MTQPWMRRWHAAVTSPTNRPARPGDAGSEIDTELSLAVATLSDGTTVLASGGTDRVVRLWDLASGEPVGEPLAADGAHWITAIAATTLVSATTSTAPSPAHASAAASEQSSAETPPPATPALVVSYADGAVRLWDLDTQTLRALLPAPAPWATCLAISTDAPALLAVGHGDGAVRVWDLRTTEGLRQLSGAGHVRAVAFTRSRTGQPLLAVARVGTGIEVWDATNWTRVNHLAPDTRVGALVATESPLGEPRLIASTERLGGDEPTGSLHLWDPEGVDPLAEAATGWITALATGSTASGERLLATGHGDGTFRIWDAQTDLRPGPTVEAAAGKITGLAVLPTEGTVALAVGSAGSIGLWTLG